MSLHTRNTKLLERAGINVIPIARPLLPHNQNHIEAHKIEVLRQSVLPACRTFSDFIEFLQFIVSNKIQLLFVYTLNRTLKQEYITEAELDDFCSQAVHSYGGTPELLRIVMDVEVVAHNTKAKQLDYETPVEVTYIADLPSERVYYRELTNDSEFAVLNSFGFGYDKFAKVHLLDELLCKYKSRIAELTDYTIRCGDVSLALGFTSCQECFDSLKDSFMDADTNKFLSVLCQTWGWFYEGAPCTDFSKFLNTLKLEGLLVYHTKLLVAYMQGKI